MQRQKELTDRQGWEALKLSPEVFAEMQRMGRIPSLLFPSQINSLYRSNSFLISRQKAVRIVAERQAAADEAERTGKNLPDQLTAALAAQEQANRAVAAIQLLVEESNARAN